MKVCSAQPFSRAISRLFELPRVLQLIENRYSKLDSFDISVIVKAKYIIERCMYSEQLLVHAHKTNVIQKTQSMQFDMNTFMSLKQKYLIKNKKQTKIILNETNVYNITETISSILANIDYVPTQDTSIERIIAKLLKSTHNTTIRQWVRLKVMTEVLQQKYSTIMLDKINNKLSSFTTIKTPFNMIAELYDRISKIEPAKEEDIKLMDAQSDNRRRYRGLEGTRWQLGFGLLQILINNTPELSQMNVIPIGEMANKKNDIKVRVAMSEVSSFYKSDDHIFSDVLSDFSLLTDYSLNKIDFDQQVREWLIENKNEGVLERLKPMILATLGSYIRSNFTYRKAKRLDDYLTSPSTWAKQGAGVKTNGSYVVDDEEYKVRNTKWADAVYLSVDELRSIMLNSTNYQFKAFGKSEHKETVRPVITGPLSLHLLMDFVGLSTDNYNHLNTQFKISTYMDDVERNEMYETLTILANKATLVSSDASKFDTQVPLWFIKGITESFKEMCMRANDSERVMACDVIIKSIPKWMILNRRITYGLPTGLRWTSLIGSLFNVVMNIVNANNAGVKTITSYHQGDDALILTRSIFDGVKLLVSYEDIGYNVNVKKTELSNKGEFLRVTINNNDKWDLRTTGNVHQSYLTVKCTRPVNRAVPAIFWRKPNKGDYVSYEEEETTDAIVNRWMNITWRSGIDITDMMIDELNRVTKIAKQLLELALHTPRSAGGWGCTPFVENQVKVSVERKEHSKSEKVKFNYNIKSPISIANIKVQGNARTLNTAISSVIKTNLKTDRPVYTAEQVTNTNMRFVEMAFSKIVMVPKEQYDQMMLGLNLINILKERKVSQFYKMFLNEAKLYSLHRWQQIEIFKQPKIRSCYSTKYSTEVAASDKQDQKNSLYHELIARKVTNDVYLGMQSYLEYELARKYDRQVYDTEGVVI